MILHLLLLLHTLTAIHHVIFLNALLYSYELNTLDACWIAVDVWSNSSRCRQESVYLSQTWCLYTWSCLDNLITMLFSINCSAVICSPTVILAIMREATSETYGPRVSFLLYCISFIYIASRLLFCNFIFQSIQQKIQKYLSYYVYQISLSQVTVKGLKTPLSHWLRVSWLFVHVLGELRVISY